MTEFLMNLTSGIRVTDVIDVALVAFVIYKVWGFIQQTRAVQLLKGLLILVIATFASGWLNLYTLNWILESTLTLGVIALIIVFQPELRRGLEYLGRGSLLPIRQFAKMGKEQAKELTSILARTVEDFSINKIGALIILERETSLNDIAETGVVLDSAISEEALGNIFYKGAPLHDGATIIRGGRIYAAGCVLPLTQNRSLSKDLGTRHRAGIGITEHSDAVSLIVSEETGIISIAVDGKLSRFLDIKTVEKTILNMYISQLSEERGLAAIRRWFRREEK